MTLTAKLVSLTCKLVLLTSSKLLLLLLLVMLLVLLLLLLELLLRLHRGTKQGTLRVKQVVMVTILKDYSSLIVLFSKTFPRRYIIVFFYSSGYHLKVKKN